MSPSVTYWVTRNHYGHRSPCLSGLSSATRLPLRDEPAPAHSGRLVRALQAALLQRFRVHF